MKAIVKSALAGFLAVSSLFGGTVCSASEEPWWKDLRTKQREFASQYDYDEADDEITFTYPDSHLYTSGIESRADESEFELPGMYLDEMAQMVGSYSLSEVNMRLVINGAQYGVEQCAIYNSRLLVPFDFIKNLGCGAAYDEDTLVATVTKGDTTLELMPYLIGMRKNKAEGYYVPLVPCPRIIEDTLYVPLRAIAEELGEKVTWDGETRTVTIDF